MCECGSRRTPDRWSELPFTSGELCRTRAEKEHWWSGSASPASSTAIGLHRAGWTPVIIERSPERRTGGYFIALFPEGRRAATELGIADHLHTRNPVGNVSTWSVNRRGGRHRSLGFLDQPGGPAAVLRGDIEAALWQSISSAGIEVRFATTPSEITNHADGVRVLLTNPETTAPCIEDFDLVVGADGMRSSVRRMVFGPHENYLTNWEAMICAFQLPEQVPSFGPAGQRRHRTSQTRCVGIRIRRSGPPPCC
jgi:2-polyprenyl-6-methoxyphenol hydroxylase-like FAD-dependent oxidoreductase